MIKEIVTFLSASFSYHLTSTSIKRYKTNDLLSYENNLLVRIVINSSCNEDSTALNRSVRRLAKILRNRCENLKKPRSRYSTIDSSQVPAKIFYSSEKLTSGKNASFWNIQQAAGSRSRPIRRRLFCDEFLPVSNSFKDLCLSFSRIERVLADLQTSSAGNLYDALFSSTRKWKTRRKTKRRNRS